jgi:MFS family permease
MLAVLAGVQFTNIADFMVLMPLAPALMRTFGVGPAEIATLVSSYTLAAALSGLLAAFWIDRVDRRRALLGLYGLFAVATLFCGLAPGFISLLVARSAAGVFGGVLGTIIFTIVGEAIPDERRGRATGLVMSSFSLATVVGVPLALLFSAAFGWHAPFLFLSLLSALIGVAGWWLLPPLPRPPVLAATSTAWSRLRETLADGQHRSALLFMVLLTSSGFLVIPFISIHMTTNVGVAEAQLPLLYLFGGVATFFSAQWVGRAADRFGKARTYRWAALASIVPLLAVTHLPSAPLALAILCAASFFVLISGRMVPAMALVNASAQPRLRGTFMSLNTSVQSGAQALAVFLGGLMVDRSADGHLLNYGLNGWAAVAMTLAAMVWAGRLRVRG